MIQSHPRTAQIDRTSLADCIQACFACADACTIGADACLGEGDVQTLIRCIRLCQDCADICDATGRVLSRQTEPDLTLLRLQLEACLRSCRLCAGECARHANGGMRMDHCRVC